LLTKIIQKRKKYFDNREYTNAFRIHCYGEFYPGLRVDLLGTVLFIDHDRVIDREKITQKFCDELSPYLELTHVVYRDRCQTVEKSLSKKKMLLVSWPNQKVVEGGEFYVKELGLKYKLSFDETFSHGLFMDQRENRKVLLEKMKPGQSFLNLFSYTGAFSLLAASKGLEVSSVDRYPRYLKWSRENFDINELETKKHRFIQNDVRAFLRRKDSGRFYDFVVVDPPTFSRDKKEGVFRVEQAYPGMLRALKAKLAPGALLLLTHNKKIWPLDNFKMMIMDYFPSTEITAIEYPADFSGELDLSQGFWVQLTS